MNSDYEMFCVLLKDIILLFINSMFYIVRSTLQQRRAFTKVVQNSYMLAVVLWRCFFYYDVGHAAFPTWLVRSTLGKTSRANQIGELNTTIELNCFGMQFVALFFFLFYPSDFPKIFLSLFPYLQYTYASTNCYFAFNNNGS